MSPHDHGMPPAADTAITPDASIWAGLSDSQRRIVLELLRRGRMSRAGLMERVGISAGSVTRLSTPLLDAGVLQAITEQVRATGRPQSHLTVDANLEHLIGVALSGDRLIAVLTDLRLTVLTTTRREVTDHRPDAVVALLAQAVEDLRSQAHDGHGTPVPVTGLGLTLGGSSRDGRVVDEAVFLGWHGVPLAAAVQARTGVSTLVGNDLVAMSEQELWFGAGREHERFCLVTVGTGIGYGLVVNGEVISSPDSELGLMGMVPVPDGARPPVSSPAMSCLTDAALERFTTLKVVGIDRDPEAIALASAKSFPQPTRRREGVEGDEALTSWVRGELPSSPSREAASGTALRSASLAPRRSVSESVLQEDRAPAVSAADADEGAAGDMVSVVVSAEAGPAVSWADVAERAAARWAPSRASRSINGSCAARDSPVSEAALELSAPLEALRAPSTTERGAATTEAEERRPVRVTRVCSISAIRRRSRRSAAAEASAARRPATIETPSRAVGSRAGHHGRAVTKPNTQAPSDTPSRTQATIPRCEAATRRRSRPWA